MGYGKGLKIICEAAKPFFEIAGIFTQNEIFYENNKEYFEQLNKYNLYEDVIEYCQTEEIDIFRSNSVSNIESLKWFAERKPDIIICYSLWEIVKNQFFSKFRNVFNIHGSYIPNLMGRAPQSWAILNGMNEIGYTIHKMTTEVDQGPIALQKKVKIFPDDIPQKIIERQNNILTDLLTDFYLKYINNEIVYIKPDFSRGSYWPKLNTEIDGQIDWTLPSYKINRMIRAFNRPFKGAWSFYKNKKVRFLQSKIVKQLEFIPSFCGVIFRKIDGETFITTGDGYIIIGDVEYSGEIKPSSELFRLGQKLNYRSLLK